MKNRNNKADGFRPLMVEREPSAFLGYNVQPNDSLENFDYFKGAKYKFTFKTVMCFLDESRSWEDRIAAIHYEGFPDMERIKEIYQYLVQPRYNPANKEKKNLKAYVEKGLITPEEYKKIVGDTIVFDYHADYDMIYALFLEKYGIDLMENDIHWWKFIPLLNLILEEDDNPLVKRIKARSFKVVEGTGQEVANHNKYWMNMKNTYRLDGEEETFESVYNNLSMIGEPSVQQEQVEGGVEDGNEN